MDDRIAIDLPREEGPRLQNLASVSGLRDPRAAKGLTALLAVVQVQEDDFMPQVAEAGNRPAAAIFRIAGMAAGDDQLERSSWLLSLLADREAAPQRCGLSQQVSSGDGLHQRPSRSRQQLRDHLAADVGQALVAAVCGAW